MADFTKINLRELENMSVKYGHGKDMEARFATKPLQLQKSGLGMQRVLPNRRIPFKHKHAEQEEVIIVVAGNGSIELDNETVELRTWDAVRIPPDVVRTAIGGPTGLEMLIIGAPYTDKQDAVMIHE